MGREDEETIPGTFILNIATGKDSGGNGGLASSKVDAFGFHMNLDDFHEGPNLLILKQRSSLIHLHYLLALVIHYLHCSHHLDFATWSRLVSSVLHFVGLKIGSCSSLPKTLSNGLGVSSFALKLVPRARLLKVDDVLGPDLGARAGHCLSADPHATLAAHYRSNFPDLLWKMMQWGLLARI